MSQWNAYWANKRNDPPEHLWRAVLLAVVCIAFLIVLCGCAMIRESAIKVSESEIKNAVAVREVAANYLSIWPIQSGFIKGAIGPRMDELPAQVVAAMEELDKLAEQYASDPEGMQDYALGQSLGLRVRMLSSIVAEALSFYMPEALDFAPFLF